jgi:hypothetical protein
LMLLGVSAVASDSEYSLSAQSRCFGRLGCYPSLRLMPRPRTKTASASGASAQQAPGSLSRCRVAGPLTGGRFHDLDAARADRECRDLRVDAGPDLGVPDSDSEPAPSQLVSEGGEPGPLQHRGCQGSIMLRPPWPSLFKFPTSVPCPTCAGRPGPPAAATVTGNSLRLPAPGPRPSRSFHWHSSWSLSDRDSA